MLVINDYVFYANAAHAKQTGILTYKEIRVFANKLMSKLVKNNIPFITETTTNDSCLTVNGHTFIRLSDEVHLVHAMDEDFMEYVNGCYSDDVRKLIEEAHDEFFLEHSPIGKRLKWRLENIGGNNETQLPN